MQVDSEVYLSRNSLRSILVIITCLYHVDQGLVNSDNLIHRGRRHFMSLKRLWFFVVTTVFIVGCSPLSQLERGVLQGDYDKVKTMVADGADIAQIDPLRGSLLCIAVKKNQQDIVKLLIESGLDVNMRDNHGRTAMHCSVSRESVELLEQLGADPFSVAENGVSPLGEAIRFGHEEAAAKLIDLGATNASWGAENRFTSLDYAIASCHLGTVKLVLANKLAVPKVKHSEACEEQLQKLFLKYGITSP